MSGDLSLTLACFTAASSLTVLCSFFFPGRNRQVEGRIQNLRRQNTLSPRQESVARLSRSMLPKIGRPLVPTTEQERTRLQSRLMYAGLYSRHALVLFLGVKMLFIAVPVVAGVVMGVAGPIPLLHGLLYGLLAGGFGIVLPSLWLDSRKKNRQIVLRRSLPDSLDMMVVCLKGGLSLQGAFQRVTLELEMAHPLLASEFAINQREIQLGRSTGEAMRHFGERCDLEEIQGLASVLLQAERLGASTIQALRVHAETLRLKRLQRAEEQGHKAATKMVFPTILCIFPSIFIVLVGPAAYQIIQLFASMKN